MILAFSRNRTLSSLFGDITPIKTKKLFKQVLTREMASNAIKEKFQLPKRYRGSTQSVWNEYNSLHEKYRPLNLGHGFTDYEVPKHITDALIAVTEDPDYFLNQYARGFGHPRLVKALSALYSKLCDRQIDPFTEILITAGAYEALHVAILSHVDKGDEVIIIEPFFDCYDPVVKMAGGIPRHIPLRLKSPTGGVTTSGDYMLDDDELASMFNEKTKLIILNTPNNPCGKVYSRDELTKIADLCKKYNVLCISDEVYEWMIYDDNEHVRICTLPDMWQRTITIGSVGKSLSVTGWKTGWAYAPANLMFNLQMVHQNCVDTCPTPIQEAIAIVLESEIKRLDTPSSYFKSLRLELKLKRDFMVNCLEDIGMKVIVPQGGYFLLADWSPLEHKVDLTSESDPQKDFRFTKWMTKNVGLLGIPPSVFYNESNKSLMENFVRYCFFKKDENLQKAVDLCRQWAKN